MVRFPLSTYETVLVATPACRATSAIVTIPLPFPQFPQFYPSRSASTPLFFPCVRPNERNGNVQMVESSSRSTDSTVRGPGDRGTGARCGVVVVGQVRQ